MKIIIESELPDIVYRNEDKKLIANKIREKLEPVLFDGDAQPLPVRIRFK